MTHAAPLPSSLPSSLPDARRRRILFRATHRGTHETDLLVGGFVGRYLPFLEGDDLDQLERIMDLPDPDLADWLSGRAPIPPEWDGALLRRMRAEAGR